ncbi:MAG: hypothetical protein LBE31_06430 [Deltaproteobacteria bacterium]|jgi:hypothetical protein|nr:hypothetical protein [Deltaproteobacteria bacterium]
MNNNLLLEFEETPLPSTDRAKNDFILKETYLGIEFKFGYLGGAAFVYI